MEPLKNLYNKISISNLAKSIKKYDETFNEKCFSIESQKKINTLEMKDRVRQIAKALELAFLNNYEENIRTIQKMLSNELELSGFILWPISQYIEENGIREKRHLPLTLQTIAILSPKFTGEFVMREYINLYESESLAFLIKCSKSQDHHLRRLASEASRPNLPWGKNLANVRSNNKTIVNILNNLKLDSSEYVRKSVANHLNDISHIDAQFVISTLKLWKKQQVNLKLIRHSLRTLLKNGNKEALKIMGYNSNLDIELVKSNISPKSISEGEKITLSVEIKNKKKIEENLLIEYIISFIKKNGTYSKKAFRLSDTTISANSVKNIKKEIHFKKVTTRKHYPGIHIIEVQINGEILTALEFKLR